LHRLEFINVAAISDDIVLPQGPDIEAPIILSFFSKSARRSSLLLPHWRWAGHAQVTLETFNLLGAAGGDLLRL
jgi:hypothetical protein